MSGRDDDYNEDDDIVTEDEMDDEIEEEVDNEIAGYERRELLQSIGAGAGLLSAGALLGLGVNEVLDGEDEELYNGERNETANETAGGAGMQQEQQSFLYDNIEEIPEPWCYPGPNDGEDVTLVAAYDAGDIDSALGQQNTRGLEPVSGNYAVDLNYDSSRGGYFAELLGGGDSQPITLTTDQASDIAELPIEVAYADCIGR